MIIDISNLKEGINNKRDFDISYSFSKDELDGSGIISLDDLRVKGFVYKNSGDFFIRADISGTMVLPCDLTLKPTDVKFSSSLDGNLGDIFKEYDLNFEKNEKSIDIFDIIWENILMEIPIKVVNEDTSDMLMNGDGWDVITDDDEKVNPNLAKLKDLLGGVEDGSSSKESK